MKRTSGFGWRVAGCGLLIAGTGLLTGSCARQTPTPQPAIPNPQPVVAPAPMLPQRLRIIGTNDFHGALDPRPDDNNVMRGGAAHLATTIRRAEQECRLPECATMLVDGGDEFQGTPASNFVFGRSVVQVFNTLGYSAAAIGNHEFDWGLDTLRARMREAHYPMLGANIRFKADGKDVPWIPNDTIVQRGPFRVGIIGFSTVETPTTTWGPNVADLRFDDEAPIVDSIAPLLRSRGADFVIVIGHLSARCSADGNCTGEAADLAKKVTARVDAIVSGHSHTYANGEVNGIPLVQARSRGQAIDIVDLYTSGAKAHREVREVIADSVPADADVLAIVATSRQYLDRVAPQINRPVATIGTTMRNSGNQRPLGNLIADAMRVVGGGDLAVMNSGGIRQSLPAGVATYGTLFEVQPFTNHLMRIRVTGENLRKYFAAAMERGAPNFHVSGARLVYHGGPNPGLDSVFVQGSPVQPQTIYTVVLNDFSANGGDGLGFGSTAIATTPTNVSDLDALIAYLASLPQPVQAPTDERITRRP